LFFQGIAPTKCTVLNTYEYSRHVLVQVYHLQGAQHIKFKSRWH